MEYIITPERAEDDVLLKAARAGDGAAFALLYERHNPMAVRLARRLGRQHDAEDVASEAFAMTLDLIKRGKGPEMFFRGYIATAVRHESGRRGKAEKRTQPTDDTSGIWAALTDVMHHDLDGVADEAIRQAYALLDERWKQVIWMTAVDGAKPREIASRFGLSDNSMSALTYRARNSLRENYIRIRQEMEDQIEGIVRDEDHG